MRKIAVLSSFFEAHHTQQVLDTAARCGFTVDLYNDDTIPQEKRGEYEVLYGFPAPSLLPTMTGMAGSVLPAPVSICTLTMLCTQTAKMSSFPIPPVRSASPSPSIL